MSAVDLESVVKRYGATTAVDWLDLSVESGEFVTLLGPSGCGKSTTLQMMAGFVTPSAGRIRIGGHDCTRQAPHRRNVGMVFQNYALFPHMTLQANVEFGLKMRGVAPAERARQAGEALALVGLDSFGDRYPGQISGGQQQRVALARALVIRPDVLLLDEPFGALDRQLRDRMRVELRDLQRRLGISLVFVTHDQDEALSMSDRIAVMSEGRLRQIGPPGEIYERPANRFVAEFMGQSNILNARALGPEGDRTLAEAGALRLSLAGAHPAGTRLEVLVRPEKIALASDPGGGAGGRIASMQYFGAIVHYRVVLAGGTELSAILPQTGADGRLAPGDAVAVTIPPDAPFVLGS
ncbi:MAG: ABC transporter ATP-binding protein [Proteobacteria bacterium]|nr:ABC transporter ATP-binding protein [Pseudomonadota bacterium]